MGRYFAEMRTIIERHGGTVEKFIGDAVMAVFGIPRAARRWRAPAHTGVHRDPRPPEASECRARAERGIAIRLRTGVNTGEVVAGDPADGQTLITGDAVNTAARLEQAARARRDPHRADHPSAGARRGISRTVGAAGAKGQGAAATAYRLLSVIGASGHARRLGAPLVGRESELAALQQAFTAGAGRTTLPVGNPAQRGRGR